ncbi:hypothetical protein NDU88_003306 [Pleurodeles waltl]|uniref:Uncharacterized protein n=1 Tax=Pleurodeles waltl TaxID=8319 RepID=A0AAV7MV84_PLEWA|nr:hypothetical protein NDU88_003306 [Pleurodeles waltl]
MHRRALRLGPHEWKAPVERNALIRCKGANLKGKNHREPMREQKLLKTGFRSDRHTIRATEDHNVDQNPNIYSSYIVNNITRINPTRYSYI